MPFARASELDRLLACPGSLVLPRTNEKSERAIEAAAYGTDAHKWMETGVVPPGKNGDTLRKKLKEAGVEREQLWNEGLHEVPLAYNVVTGAARALVLPVSSDKKEAWKAGYDSEWVCGTADYVGSLLDAPWVDDLKTGRRADYLNYRYQQGFYTMVWSLFSMGELVTSRSTITHWPKYPLTKKPIRFGVVLEPEFFTELQVSLRTLWEDARRLKALGSVNAVVERLNDGEQCVFCPSKLACAKGLKYE